MTTLDDALPTNPPDVTATRTPDVSASNQEPDLERLVNDARRRLSETLDAIVALIGEVDPLELLCHIALLYQRHSPDQSDNNDEMAKWQTRLELLTEVICARNLAAPQEPSLIDAGILSPLEKLLDRYFHDSALSLMQRDSAASTAQHEIRVSLQLEALFVRGIAYSGELRQLAVGLYGPHAQWCLDTLGVTIEEAFSVFDGIRALLQARLESHQARGRELKQQLLENPSLVFDMPDLPAAFIESLAHDVPAKGDEPFARSVSLLWCFFNAGHVIGFTVADVMPHVPEQISIAKAEATFKLLSIEREQIGERQTVLALSALAITPLVAWGGRCYLFAPGVLAEGLFYSFHRKLFGDAKYRQTYDDSRVQWLETGAIKTLASLLKGSLSGHSLEYGKKGLKAELDGLVLYDNKLILIECKWKSPRLSALEGDVAVALDDLEKAIIAPLQQAKRARDFIRASGRADFVEKLTGRVLTIDASNVHEIYLLTVVGSGSWGQLVANLPLFAPAGYFGDGEYPWALSIGDLRTVVDCLELPSQLFDYLRRRYATQQDGRFHLHDEWDFLGVYLTGHLDPNDEAFRQAANADVISLDGFDSEIQKYHYSLSNPNAASVDKPRRKIPNPLIELLGLLEASGKHGKTDAITEILSWSDEGLNELADAYRKLRQKVIWDGRAHSFAVKHPVLNSGVAFCCGHQDRQAIRDTLDRAIRELVQQFGATRWVAIGVDLRGEVPLLLWDL